MWSRQLCFSQNKGREKSERLNHLSALGKGDIWPSQPKKTHVIAKLGSNSATSLPLSELCRTQDVYLEHMQLWEVEVVHFIEVKMLQSDELQLQCNLLGKQNSLFISESSLWAALQNFKFCFNYFPKPLKRMVISHAGFLYLLCSGAWKIMITWYFMNTNKVSWGKKLSLENVALVRLETVEVSMQHDG